MFRNLSIRTKLIVILAGPLLALTVLASVGIGSSLAASMSADRVSELSGFARKVAPLVHQLQQERTLTYAYVAEDRRSGREALAEQRQRVDRGVSALNADAGSLDQSHYPARVRAAVEEGIEHLAELPEQRQAIDTAPAGEEAPGVDDQFIGASGLVAEDQERFDTVDQALIQYTNTIGDLLDINARIALGSDDERLLAQVANLDALSRAQDAVALESALATRIFTIDRFTERDREQLISIKSAERLWLARYRDSAAPAKQEWIASFLTDPRMRRVAQFEQKVLTTSGSLGVDPENWLGATEPVLGRLQTIESRLGDALRVTSAERKASANRQALLFSVLVTIVLWGAVGLLLLAARSMVNPLTVLRNAANHAAERRLPSLVERLQRGEVVDPRAAAEPIPVSSRDEIGQVADAFNSVHLVAAQVAGEQAALRKSIGDLFFNLARRNQSLIDRQLAVVDELELKEAEPERLEDLFRLDHLATRMRRNAENLVVLSGAEPPRRGRRPVALNDVVRAALAEVEDYTRVDIIPLADMALVGHAVSDVVHLLAELIENATEYSPPETKVHVAGHLTPTGYVLEIEDAGIGMSDEDLMEVNQRLLHPPAIDLTLSRTLGFYVVGRLATRYGIRVQLRHSWYGGTTALALLPRELLGGLPDNPLEVARAGGRARRHVAPSAEVSSLSTTGRTPLPIFDSVRDDWISDREMEPYAPLRRHLSHRAAERSAAHRRETNGAFGALRAEPANAWQERPEPQEPPGPRTNPHQAPTDVEPMRHARTSVGLPRRVPRASLASQIAATSPPTTPGGPPVPERPTKREPSPDDTGGLLARYRSGLERGRVDTGLHQGSSTSPSEDDGHAAQ